MKMKLKAKASVAFGALALFAGAIGPVWACTATASIQMAPDALPRGRQALASGSVFQPGPVELRWNSLAGPLIATASADSNAEFSTLVTVPQTEPGVHYIVAVSGGQRVASASVLVTDGPAGTGSAVKSDLWTGFASRQAPSMGSPDATLPESNSKMALGMGLLTFGLTAAVSGAGLAAVSRRRRVPAAPSSEA